MTLKELQKAAHEVSFDHGFWDTPSVSTEFLLSKLALVHSEISEAAEELREQSPRSLYFGTDFSDEHGKPCGYGVELADAMIRIMDLAEYLGVDLEALISLKAEYNAKRPYKHSKRA